MFGQVAQEQLQQQEEKVANLLSEAERLQQVVDDSVPVVAEKKAAKETAETACMAAAEKLKTTEDAVAATSGQAGSALAEVSEARTGSAVEGIKNSFRIKRPTCSTRITRRGCRPSADVLPSVLGTNSRSWPTPRSTQRVMVCLGASKLSSLVITAIAEADIGAVSTGAAASSAVAATLPPSTLSSPLASPSLSLASKRQTLVSLHLICSTTLVTVAGDSLR